MPKGGRQPGAGRPKGSRNKATAEIRKAIDSKDPIGKLFKIAEDEDTPLDTRTRALLGVLPYAYPKLAASQVDINTLRGDVNLHLHAPKGKK